jgi:hypothetical protein
MVMREISSGVRDTVMIDLEGMGAERVRTFMTLIEQKEGVATNLR